MRISRYLTVGLGLAGSLLADGLLAGSLRLASRSVEEVVPQMRGYGQLEKTHRVIALPDGSRFILHLERNSWERNAIAGTLLKADGERKNFLAENFVPSGPGGHGDPPAPMTVGQIYGATLFPDGDTMAVSIGWTDAKGRSHNAIAIRSLKRGMRNLIEFDGTVRDLAAGPGNLILAATYVPGRASKERGAPLLTALDTRGVVHGEFFPLARGAETRTIVDSVHNARNQRLGPQRFAFYQEPEATVSILDLSVDGKISETRPWHGRWVYPWPMKAVYSKEADVSVSVKQVIGLPDPEKEATSQRGAITLGVHVEPDGAVTVARSFGGDRPHTTVRRYRAGEPGSKDWSPATPWQAAYWTDGSLVGVTGQDVTVLESVTFEENN